jgi:hypothetical protein
LRILTCTFQIYYFSDGSARQKKAELKQVRWRNIFGEIEAGLLGACILTKMEGF